MCLACRSFGNQPLCPHCRDGLRAAGTQRLEQGVVVRSAFVHEGPARLVVHRLKYEGILEAAAVLADAMVPLLPAGGSALVPVPRVVLRAVMLGVDPAGALAEALGRRCGLPVVPALAPALAGRRHAGHRREDRRPPSFRLVAPFPPRAVLVDDVVTTGMSLSAAASAVGTTALAVTATAAVGGGARTSGEWTVNRR